MSKLTKRFPDTKFYAWCECNDRKAESIEHVLDGMRKLSDGSEVIVTSTRGQFRKVLGELTIPPLIIGLIGGVKTHSYSPYGLGLDSRLEHSLRSDIHEIGELTGMDVVVLENERLLRKFHEDGILNISMFVRELKKLLRYSPMEPWFYFPEVVGASAVVPGREVLTVRLVSAIARAVPKAQFITGYRAFHGWRDDEENVRLMRRMERLVGVQRMIPVIRVRTDEPAKRRPAFTPDQLLKEKDMPPLVIIYTGFDQWVRTIEALA